MFLLLRLLLVFFFILFFSLKCYIFSLVDWKKKKCVDIVYKIKLLNKIQTETNKRVFFFFFFDTVVGGTQFLHSSNSTYIFKIGFWAILNHIDCNRLWQSVITKNKKYLRLKRFWWLGKCIDCKNQLGNVLNYESLMSNDKKTKKKL